MLYMELQFLFSAHCLIMVLSVLRFARIPLMVQSYGTDTILKLIITKEHISVNIVRVKIGKGFP